MKPLTRLLSTCSSFDRKVLLLICARQFVFKNLFLPVISSEEITLHCRPSEGRPEMVRSFLFWLYGKQESGYFVPWLLRLWYPGQLF